MVRWTAEAKPIAIPVAKVGDQDMLTVLTNEKYLLLLLLANAGYIIWGLIRSIWDSKKSQLEIIQKAVEIIPLLKEKVDKIEDSLRRTPTHDQIELKILRAMHKKTTGDERE